MIKQQRSHSNPIKIEEFAKKLGWKKTWYGKWTNGFGTYLSLRELKNFYSNIKEYNHGPS